MQGLTRHQEQLYIIGAILAIVGSFLPWVVEGDFVSYWTWGIQIKHLEIEKCLKGLYDCPLKDNGGFLILLLSITVVLLVFRTPTFLKHPRVWVVACTAILVLLSLYHLGKVWVQHLKAAGMIGAPEPRIGLFMVLCGSLLMCGVAMANYRRYRTA